MNSDHPTRETLETLLLSWRAGTKTAKDVHEQAEEWFETCKCEALPRSDPRAIELEVLSQLDILPQQFITPDDVPAFLAFLATPIGGETDGWEKWQRYWDGLDFDKRRASLRGHPYYGI